MKRSLEPLLREGPREIKAKELEADSYGVAYMTMAGYGPAAVLRSRGSFLEEWGAQVAAETAEYSTHPQPKERVAFLRTQLDAVVDEPDFFRIGVRLYQLGRFDDAILFLEKFRDRFPGREVFNDLALGHYQLAIRSLADCGVDAVLRFKLPTRLEPDTLAKRIPSRGDSDCLRAPAFRRHVDEAIRYLDHATGMDPSDVPARINLASALILTAEYARALSAAEDALKIAPNDPGALNTKAVA